MSRKKVFKNKNGNLTVEDFVKMIHNNKVEDYMRKFKTTTHPCPPMELIDPHNQCFYCVSCTKHCIEQVKEHKKYYKVGRQKFSKEELDDKGD